jgi:hypothetical protein
LIPQWFYSAFTGFRVKNQQLWDFSGQKYSNYGIVLNSADLLFKLRLSSKWLSLEVQILSFLMQQQVSKSAHLFKEIKQSKQSPLTH